MSRSIATLSAGGAARTSFLPCVDQYSLANPLKLVLFVPLSNNARPDQIRIRFL
jgi:hypothetical protein